MSSPSELPRRFGDYEVLFEIATGGTASVLLARQVGDAGFERLVALKRVHRHLLSDPEVFSMASDEARLAALVRHPNVVSVVGVIDAGNELVLVQEYVEGSSLATLLKRLGERGIELPLEVAVKIVTDAARGLHAAHEVKDLRGEPLDLVHRDVSPQNLLIGADGTTRIIDFGIARAERRMTLTKTGIIKGKLQYMAPEQVEEKSVDRRADVFALGAVLYEAVSGKKPFGSGEEAAIMGRILLGDVDFGPIAERSPAIAELLASALAKDPDARPKTALELGRALTRAVPPADEEDVKAIVETASGDALRDMRARIASSLGALDEGGELEIAAAPNEDPSASTNTKALAAPRQRPRRGGLAVGLGAAAMLAIGTAIVMSQRATPIAATPTTSSSPAVTQSAAATTSAPAPPSTTPTAVAPAAASSSSASAPEPRATHRHVATHPSAAPAATSAAPPKPSSELMPSPYPKP